MAHEDDGSPDPKLLSMQVGVVVDNTDPEKLGRVRVRIPGLIETKSAWALPMGAPGGGSGQRGFFDAPAVGADVCIWFKGGDIDHPHYLPSNWGRGQQPAKIQDSDVSPEDAPKVHAYETDRWQMTFDDRPGKSLLQLRDKTTGDVVELDGEGMGINIKGTAMVNIQATGQINIQGLIVTINGRLVGPGGPI